MVISMKKSQSQMFLYLLGIVILSSVFLYEQSLNHRLITLIYLVVLPFILLLSENKIYAVFIGFLTTVFIGVGYFLSDFNGYQIFTHNRILAGITAWLMVCFSIYFKQTLKSEKEAIRRLNAIVENATEGIIVINASGEIIMVNPCATKLFGYQERELIGRKIEYLMPDRYVKGHNLLRSRFLHFPNNRRMSSGLELYAKRKDNSEILVEISLGHFRENDEVQVISFITDITERKLNLDKISQLNEDLEARVHDRTKKLSEAYQIMEKTNLALQKEIAARENAEKNLIKTQDLYEAMARHFPNGVIGILDKDLNYLLVNGTGMQEIELEEANLLEEKVFDNLSPSEKIVLESKLKKALEGETVSFEVIIKENYYNVKAVPLPDKENCKEKILIVITNVTAVKENEMTLIKTLEREKELGKIKTRFVSTASHEFRTPLGTIMTSAYLLKNLNGSSYDPVKDTHIQRINKSVIYLTDILNDFLSLSKLDEEKVEIDYKPLDIYSFLFEIKKEMDLQIPNGLKLKYDHTGVKLLASDKKILKKIVLNLLSNAIKYSKSEGWIQLSSSVKMGYLTLKVQDHGIGIPKDDLPYIFNRFFRAENVSHLQGTGLGLNIVKKHVELLDGIIICSSTINSGSTFTVKIPLKDTLKIEKQTNHKPI